MVDNTTIALGSGGDVIRTVAKLANNPAKSQVVIVDVGGGADGSSEVALTTGQKVGAGSVSVVIASDQSAVPIAETGGVAISSATMPSGGVGLTGWLSAIYKALTGSLTAVVSGSVSITGTSPISTAAIAPVATTVAASSLVLKASGGNLFSVVFNASASGYLMIFDATGAPADGAVTPKWAMPLAANAGLGFAWPNGLAFATGIVAVYSSTGPFNKTASVTAFISGQVV